MGKKKKTESRLASVLADRQSTLGRATSEDDSGDDEPDIELSAMDMLDTYKKDVSGDKKGSKLRRKVTNTRKESTLCLCCKTRHCVGCCLIILLILTIIFVVVMFNLDWVETQFNDIFRV